ncbi:hypothetical protein [Heyndrickxia ginsengihumi]|uniref:Stress-response A/B barrel domain-containing protein n=1 Tax=Heyndrickxia ginsengihumi TaxID=363870 RepID=A0A0A6VCF1_9BACI|nr:hypothetical protein [Heyndrickxia ginsengihumi]KHD84214.1 hypothetical protein NG54_17015 [Heyndrickxia ginsengihumi]MBE6184055.1 hypothetical protein [Bacillus sp. (in: firmicutes)]MCM3024576.1 hypothetical protein [Heyndrickxia ginsengihumi]NEY18785.1 hypothetical protein [Heyndrickxia ginsengihumi]
MPVFVYQTFEIKQNKFKEALDGLKAIQSYRKKKYNQRLEILTPISGKDHTYGLLSSFEGLAEMELQHKKMFDDEEYKKIISAFLLEHIVQGSSYTQLYRSVHAES